MKFHHDQLQNLHHNLWRLINLTTQMQYEIADLQTIAFSKKENKRVIVENMLENLSENLQDLPVFTCRILNDFDDNFGYEIHKLKSNKAIKI